tara:strand:+ start:958 stop:1266 length:309 start_codon:yes stop_codon:yes gene_type:complete
METEEEKRERKRNLTGLLLGTASGLWGGVGLNFLLKYHSKIESLRDAVYAQADKITPEIIERANEQASEVGTRDYHFGLLCFALAGFFGIKSYLQSRRDSTS